MIDEAKQSSIIQLLADHAAIIDELKRREVVRKRDNPLGGYTEWLVGQSLGLEVLKKDTPGHDAIKPGTCERYSIKGRRSDAGGAVPNTSAIKGVVPQGFDHLVIVLFHNDFSIHRAVQVSHGRMLEIIEEVGTYNKNAHTVRLNEEFASREGVQSIKDCLLSVQRMASLRPRVPFVSSPPAPAP